MTRFSKTDTSYEHRMILKSFSRALGCLIIAPGFLVSTLACDAASDRIVASLTVTAPMLARYGPALRVEFFEDDCIEVIQGPWTTRPGRHVIRLEQGAAAAFQDEMYHAGASTLASPEFHDLLSRTNLEPSRLRHFSIDSSLFRVFLRLYDGTELTIERSGIETDRLNFPDVSEFVVLESVIQRLWMLADSDTVQ